MCEGLVVGNGGSVVVEHYDGAGRFELGRGVFAGWSDGGALEAVAGFGPKDGRGGVLAGSGHFEESLGNLKISVDGGGRELVLTVLAERFASDAQGSGDLRLRSAQAGHTGDLETVGVGGVEGAAAKLFSADLFLHLSPE